MTRNKSVDGLRGLAALNVTITHFMGAFVPMLLHRNYPWLAHKNEDPSQLFNIFQSPLFSLFYNGHLAVLIFFVLSGYVLAIPYYQNNLNTLRKRLWGRYFRLNIPIAASISLSFLIYNMDWFYNVKAADISGSTWLNNFFPKGITWLNYFELSAYKAVFFGDGILNPVLWTLKIEFIGSIYLLSYYLCKLRNHEILTMIFTISALYTFYKADSIYYISIFLGALLHKIKVDRNYLFLLLITGLFFGAFQYEVKIYSYLPSINVLGLEVFHKKTFYNTISAIFIVLSVVNGGGRKLLESNIIQLLGGISFSLYLLHIIILSSVVCYMFTVLPQSKCFLLLIFLVYLLICFISSLLFEKTIGKLSISLGKAITTKLFETNSPIV